MTQVERAGMSLTVDRTVVLNHTVLQVDHDKRVVGVAITRNPLEFDERRLFCQVVMHKTRSHNCAVQVARYVRRRFEVHAAVETHRVSRPLEAKIGYACTRTMQYEPNERTPGWGVFQHIAATSIKGLLEEVAGGDNAARTRYTVYEVRGSNGARFRGTTNKLSSIERMFREAPPDTIPNADVVVVGQFASNDDAQRAIGAYPQFYSNSAWTRRPSPEYVRKHLRIENSDIVWSCDGSGAVRPYRHQNGDPNPCVVIGPHVYTEAHVRHCLVHGSWFDGMIRRGSGPIA